MLSCSCRKTVIKCITSCLFSLSLDFNNKKTGGSNWCPLTGVTLQVSETPADIATAVSAGDFFLSHAPLVVD